jgi:transposase-like protein
VATAGQLAAEAFFTRYGTELPSAAACFSEDLAALLAHQRLPWRHRKFVRTTNLIERSFVEERRRTKALPRFFTEASCLKLVYATLLRATVRWQRIMISKLELQQLESLRRELGLTHLELQQLESLRRELGLTHTAADSQSAVA